MGRWSELVNLVGAWVGEVRWVLAMNVEKVEEREDAWVGLGFLYVANNCTKSTEFECDV